MTFVERALDGICSSADVAEQERATINCNHITKDTISQSDVSIRTLDNVGPRSLVKIYCACGRIVDLDKKKMNIKKSLKKDLECAACRNTRISREIDILDAHYDGSLSVEEDLFC